MPSLLIGAFLLLAVLGTSLRMEALPTHLPMGSIILVLGGTISLLWLSIPMSGLRSLFQSLLFLFKKEKEFSTEAVVIQSLLKNRTAPAHAENPLINYAVELWQQGVDADLFVVLLSQKRREIETQGIDAIQSLKNLAKYPPALGMIATVMGMVSLFSKLDENKSNIGVSLSLAMTSTLLGLVLTNALLAPLADRLQIKQVREQRFYESVYQVLLLINNQEPASLIEEEVKFRAA